MPKPSSYAPNSQRHDGKASAGVALELASNSARYQQLAGQAHEAESTYRQILTREPENDVALYSLGLIACRKGKLALAAKLIGRAIDSNPAQPQYHCDLGLIQLGRGKLEEAAIQLEAASVLSPEDARIYGNLGNLRLEQNKPDEAAASFRRAVALDPQQARAQFGLGLALYAQGMLDDSATCFRRAAELDPNDGDALSNLGLALHAQGKFDEAIAVCRRALLLDPNNPNSHNTFGLGLHAQGRLEDAATCFRQALALRPDYPEAHNNLGNVFGDQGRPQEASACFRRALTLRPAFAGAYNNLGNALRAQGDLAQASACFQKALGIDPRSDVALNNLGVTCQMQGLPGRALRYFEKALAIRPDWPVTHINLGRVMQEFGDAETALECFRKAVELKPDYILAYHNLLMCMNYVSNVSAADIFAEHKRFGEIFEAPLRTRRKPHGNIPDPERRLRIGYVSADFYQHAVFQVFEPALAMHDRNAFEIYCYPNGTRHDEITERLKSHADAWRSLVGQSDERAAEQIRDDNIDILVDLSGHTAGNRLMVFACKPAPVQVSAIGYVTTTGLTSIDYRITDGYADPPGQTDVYHTECLWRLPCVTVYRPVAGSPPVGPLPALSGNYFSFACLNNLAKVTPETVSAWARILRVLPKTRLILGNAGDRSVCERLLRGFARHGVGASQLVFKSKLPLLEYLRLHDEIDLALDPFPYNGGASSCHSLWMGVPFVTLSGDRYMARVGTSMLANLGLTELIANKLDEYVSLACEFASDPARLAAIRASLRERMASSPLLDFTGFSHNLESAYRAMWRAWCVH